MALDSKRELCLEALKSLVENTQGIKTVVRQRLGYEQLGNFAETQLPVAAVVGKLPLPEPKWSSRNKHTPDLFISKLEVEITVFLSNAADDHDTQLSNVADELWKNLWKNLTLDSNAFQILVVPNSVVSVWPPYVAFRFVVTITYQHTIGGL